MGTRFRDKYWISRQRGRVESNCCYGRVLRDASLVSHASLEFGLLKILDMKAAEIRAQHGPLENLTQQSTLLSALRGESE